MAKKKKPGQLPSGNYRARVCIGKDENGVRKFRSFTAPSKAEADFLAHQYLMQHGHSPEDAKPAEMTLGMAYTAYISSKSEVLSPSTIRNYYSRAKNDFQELMQKPLSEITQETVQIAVNLLAASHSPKTVRNAHGLLSAVLSAYKPDMVLHTRLPQKVQTELYVPTREDIRTLMQELAGTELEKAVLLAAFCSLRRSEVCALTAENVDYQNGIISISEALVPGKETGWQLKQPKSDAGYRIIRVPAFIIARLPREGRIVGISPSTITNRFHQITERLFGSSFRFHDLRHYQASILTAMGVPDAYIIERCGWQTDHTLKQVYQHTMSDKRRQVEDEICAKFDRENR